MPENVVSQCLKLYSFTKKPIVDRPVYLTFKLFTHLEKHSLQKDFPICFFKSTGILSLNNINVKDDKKVGFKNYSQLTFRRNF